MESDLQAPRLERVDESVALTPRIKRLAPAVPSWYVRRPALERKLEQAGKFRLTAVVAGAGFGKTTHLAACAHSRGWAWYTVDGGDASHLALARGIAGALRERLPALPDAVVPAGAGGDERSLAESLAAALAGELELLLDDDLVLVVDDAHELGDGPALRLLEGLIRFAPPEFHLVLSSRNELPFPISRLRGQGQVLDVDTSQLAFTVGEVAALLVGVLGSGADDLAGAVHEAAGGWPAAVHLTADILASTAPSQRSDAVDALIRRRGPLFSYLAEEVFGREPAEARRVVRTAAEFDRVTPDLCVALGLPHAYELLRSLARRGLVLEPPDDSGGWYSLHALVRQFARDFWTLDAAEARELRLRAARWFEETGMLAEALDSLASAHDVSAIEHLIADRGQALIHGGALSSVARAAALLPRELRERAALTVAHCHILLGEFDQAREWLSAFDAPPDHPFLSFHLALIHVNRDEPQQALAILQAAEAAGCDEPMHNAFIASQLLMLGRLAEAQSYAERAFAGAGSEGATPLSEAHAILGELAFANGDLAEANARFDAALEIGERVGNVLATVSALSRLASLHLEQGRYTEALEEATRALELADRVGFSLFQAGAPSVRGLALLALGRLEEAIADFSLAVTLYERLGSNSVATPLIGMGTVQAERGELSQARSSFERAADIEPSGVVNLRAEALAGLARVLVDEDPDEAERLVQMSLATAVGGTRVLAGLAAGWIALRRGDREHAHAAAVSASIEARRRGAPALLAEALELEALSAAEPEAELRSLEEAVAIWSKIGHPIGKAKAELALARLRGSDEDAVRAEGALLDLGCRPNRAAAGILLPVVAGRREPLAIQTLGRFAVLRDGEAVPVGEWQSKKARDLLRLLVSRRGSSTPRDFLMETLWPDEDPRLTSNRLSVALNVVRTVLDPQRRLQPDHYIASTSDGVRLVHAHVPIDVESFLESADRALRLSAAEGSSRALTLLEEAEAAYGGDFLEEDRYDDWAAPLREEARAAYLDVLRALVSAAESGGRPSARYYLRILALDPFDEGAHLGFVSSLSAAGRHGEARRAYRRYVERMDEIGVEPAPRPGR